MKRIHVVPLAGTISQLSILRQWVMMIVIRRRSVVSWKKSDPRTKEHLRACLSEDLLSRLRLYPSRVEACTCENDEYLVQALESIYRASGHHKVLESDTIDDTLQYCAGEPERATHRYLEVS